jgi:hypothetical protein
MQKRAVPMKKAIETGAKIDLFIMSAPLALAGEGTVLSLEAASEAEAGAQGFNFAVGLSEHLPQFAEETGSLTYVDIAGDGVFVPENFSAIADAAETINFNTQGLNWARWGQWAVRDQQLSVHAETVTNWELHQLLTNPNWLNKVIWH